MATKKVVKINLTPEQLETIDSFVGDETISDKTKLIMLHYIIHECLEIERE